MKFSPVEGLPPEVETITTVTETVTETVVVTRTPEAVKLVKPIDYSQRKHPLAKCEDCSLRADVYVPSSGPTEASIVIVGEAPGGFEAKSGVPFSGPSGRLLDTVLKHHSIERADVFVTNVVACRPPLNRTPSKHEIACCSERLTHDIESVNTTSILALGNTAASAILDTKTKITQLRAGPPKESPRFLGIQIVPSIHPAACLRATDSFPSLVKDVGKLVGGKGIQSGWEPPAFRVFDEPDQACKALQELSESRYPDLVVDIETAYDKDAYYEHPHHYRLLCVGLSYRAGSAIVISEASLQDSRVRHLLASNLENRNLVAHNGKFDRQGLDKITKAPLAKDTMLMSYCADERQGTHGLEYLAVEHLGSEHWKFMNGHRDFAGMPTDDLHYYNAIDCSNTFMLKEHYEATLSADSKRLHEFLVRTSNALVPVELEGIGVDQPYLQTLKKTYKASLAAMESELATWVKNPRSNPQVADALRKLGVPFVKTTDKMFLQTVFERPYSSPELKHFCGLLLNYRKEQKVFGTYITGAEKRLFEGRLYPTFLQHGTTTGRISCRNPNLYNIPRGSSTRKIFVANPGNVFVQADYSQIELRVVTCEAEEPYFMEIFRDTSRDTHQEVADRLGITRQVAKMVVYGLSYEMSANGLAFRLGISLPEATRYVREFHNVIPQIVRWKESVKRTLLHDHEDLVTPYGRHRRFWLITAENREDLIKEAIAFYPQSIASDICQTAVCQLVEDGLKVRLSVYDSIMVECPEADAVEVGHHMEKRMLEAGRAYSEYIPFDVETKIGRSWGDFG